MNPRATGLLLGVLLDRLLPDPRHWHPVAGFGRTAALVERATYADSRAAGTLHVAVLTGAAVGVGRALDRPGTTWRVLSTAACTWTVLGGSSLAREARTIEAQLGAGDLPAARRQLTHLVGRDTRRLGEAEIVRAAVESVAENTADAVVAPLLWGAVAGPAGLLGYRAANTLDAMIGHRTRRYARFGWAAARLDDLLNLVPARLCAGLTSACAPLVGGRPAAALGAWRRDAAGHPSPNAGVVEAAFAGALGVRLGGRNHYASGVEDRVRLGSGTPPERTDLRRTVELADAVDLAATVVAAVLAGAVAGAGGVLSRRRATSGRPRRC